MSLDTVYTAVAHASGAGRDGQVRSEDDHLDLQLRAPLELGGSGGGVNPEQLFAAGYASSFLQALHDAGNHLGIDASDSQVSAEVGMAPNGSGGFELAVELDISTPAAEPGRRQELVDLAHAICPFSNAVRGDVEVRLTRVD